MLHPVLTKDILNFKRLIVLKIFLAILRNIIKTHLLKMFKRIQQLTQSKFLRQL